MKSLLACLALGSLLGAAPAMAQAKPAKPKPRFCTEPDSTLGWFKSQREWWTLDAAHDWSNDSLRTELLAAIPGPVPTAARFPIQVGAMMELGKEGMPIEGADSARIMALRARLRELASKRSWPVRSLVGPAGVRAAWLIASGDSALAIAAMHRMMESGPGEASQADVATLEDWQRIQRGRKQLYGSQLIEVPIAGGKFRVEPAPTEDMRHVDLRRDGAGIPPLPQAMCAVATQRAAARKP